MRLLIKQRVFSWTDSYDVYDENENPKYFVKAELIPAIIVEEGTNEVLMLAYMNLESLAKTMETGYTWFYSRCLLYTSDAADEL